MYMYFLSKALCYTMIKLWIYEISADMYKTYCVYTQNVYAKKKLLVVSFPCKAKYLVTLPLNSSCE